MHVLKGSIRNRGPMIDVKVMQSEQRVEALKRLNQPYAQPVTIVGLVDTGAGCTAIDRNIAQRLALEPRGVTKIHTPSTGSDYEDRNLFDASLVIGEGYAKPLVVTLPVIESDFASQGFLALIGRDILDKCFLMYDGSTSMFTLFF
jgi:hypothetical protein